jgi:hypothetical protein
MWGDVGWPDPELPVAGHPAVSGLGRHRRHLARRVPERLPNAV